MTQRKRERERESGEMRFPERRKLKSRFLAALGMTPCPMFRPCMRREELVDGGMAGGAGLPAFVDPEPLVGMAASEVFNDASEALGVGADVGVEVAGAEEFEGRLEAEAVFPEVAIPVAVAGDDGGVGLQGEAGKAGGGAGGNAEEIHKDAFAGQGVEVEEDANGATRAQDAKDGADGVGFVYGDVAGKTAIAIDEGVDARIVERTNKEVQREAVESLGGRAKFPGAHVSGEIENALAAMVGGGEVFETVGNDDAVDASAVEVV